jgi:hypothetical protein
MKYILILLAISLTGCTTATNYTQAEKDDNCGEPPKIFLGMKVYPNASLKILNTPMMLAPSCSVGRSTTTYINTTTTVKHSNGSTTTYTTKGYIH